jgi:hypothetical protein
MPGRGSADEWGAGVKPRKHQMAPWKPPQCVFGISRVGYTIKKEAGRRGGKN